MAELIRLPDVAMASLRVPTGSKHGLPPIGHSTLQGPDRLVAIGPDEWLAIGPDSNATSQLERMGSFASVYVDVSGNRACYRASGNDVAWFLSAGISYDLDQLQPNDAISTTMARAQVVLIMEAADQFLLLPRRSFAQYIETWAANALM